MQIEYAILAERAGRLDGNALCVFGMGIDRVEASSFPSTIQFALIVQAKLLPDEPLEGHTLTIVGRRPDGVESPLAVDKAINTKRNVSDSTLPSSSSIMLNLHMQAKERGWHEFDVVIDGSENRTVGIFVDYVDGEVNGG